MHVSSCTRVPRQRQRDFRRSPRVHRAAGTSPRNERSANADSLSGTTATSRLHIEEPPRIAGNTAESAFHILATYLRDYPHEGIVWHHPDGRRAKIKRRDFGHPWPLNEQKPGRTR